MSNHLGNEVIDLLEAEGTFKVLTTTDEKGTPHAVIKQTIRLAEDGNILYLELLESSRTNKNMVHSIWFKHKVAITLCGKNGVSYQIKGRPVKALISGPIFQENYVDIRNQLGDVELSTVWIIEPEEVINETYSIRKVYEEETRPYFKHLDRLVKL